MASHDKPAQAIALPSALDRPGVWLWQFLKTELAPYPGRAWVVGRITLAATVTMVLVMTFQIPYGFLAALYALLLSRESPTMTFRTGMTTVLSYAVATVYTIVGATMAVGDPLTHFLWIAISLLLVFYTFRISPDYRAAVAFGLPVAVAVPLWDQGMLTVNQRTEDTLWIGLAVLVGSAVTVAVEYVFNYVRPIDDLTRSLASRLLAVEDLLRQIAADRPIGGKVEKDISLYSALGTSGARRQLLRSGRTERFIAQMNAYTALVGHLVDLAASMYFVRSSQSIAVTPADRERCLRLANQISEVRHNLQLGQIPHAIRIPSQDQASDLPLLPEMERTAALLPHAFSGLEPGEEPFVPPPLGAEARPRVFAADAFTNPDHLKFAIRGALATLVAYVAYQAVNWPGLSTAVITCVITALSTIGSSRQRQLFRLSGAILGGAVLGIGAQVFVLPNLDSITGFTLLFVAVTSLGAWIITATPRLSFLGVQFSVAFYLVNLQGFTIQTSLADARDQVAGVLLGLLSMHLVFDRLWVRDAFHEMEEKFARNLRLLAELIDQSRQGDLNEAASRVNQLRDQINKGFNAVKSQADAVIFEFGPSRAHKLEIRDDIRRWQPTLGVLLQVQITFLEYLFAKRFAELPQIIAEAETSFEQDMAITAEAMSADIEGKSSIEAPDIQSSAQRLRRDVQKHYAASGLAIPPPLADMIALTQNLASIIAPLYADIHATFTRRALQTAANTKVLARSLFPSTSPATGERSG